MTSVLIALEAPFVQVGVRVTIENTADFEVAGVVCNGDAVMESVAELRPGIVLLDSHFQKADQQLVSQLTQDFPDCQILVMADHTEEGCPEVDDRAGQKPMDPGIEQDQYLLVLLPVVWDLVARLRRADAFSGS